MKNKKLASLLLALLLLLASAAPCFAITPTDEVLNYYVLADVNEDGTVSLFYHIEWKVLDDQKYGPVDWLKIGVANRHCSNITPITDNITDIYYDYDYGDYVDVYFDKSYYAGDVVEFEFMLDQDYLYSVDYEEVGYTTFYFLPGWFDDTPIDRQAIYWNADKVHKWDMGATTADGYLVWEFHPEIGQTKGVMLTYPNDAYGFDTTKYGSWDKNYDPGYDPGYEYDDDFSLVNFFAGLFALIIGLTPLWIFIFIVRAIKKAYQNSSGFASEKTTTKITRTKVEYYPNCPGCGAQRKEGQTTCEYCGRSFIKSEEILKEEKIKDEDKEALKYKKKGEYAYSSAPNTYVRVNVVHVPVSTSHSGGSGHRPGGGSGSSGGSGRSSSSHGSSSHHSSCAHSSCACACASCACACACACAGGGRAGCSTKDFYNTKLKLKQLELKKKRRKG